jgi:hypothetical protein
MGKYITKSLPYPTQSPFKSNNPPFSIPGTIMPRVDVHDDLLDIKFQKEIYQYLLEQPWYNAWLSIAPELQIYKPIHWDDSWIQSAIPTRTLAMSRCMFGSDEDSIKQTHPIIWKLWQHINQHLDNRYSIAGVPEGVYWKDLPVPAPTDPELATGWRVYANGSPHMLLSPGAEIHRDNKDLLDNTTVTIIYMASPEWYPSWGGEIQFYPEDPEKTTGDHQQFNFHGQQRNFCIGWNDQGKTVCLKPNRLLVYDSRTLHATMPPRNCNNNQLHRRVVFRAQLKKEYQKNES